MRLFAALAATAPVLAGLSLVGGAADAALVGSPGPTNPDTNFPAYYTDLNGLSLQLCLDDPVAVNCLTTRDELLNAGADGEAFYASASAEVGDFGAEYALEAAFAGDGANQEIVFARTRYIGTGEPNSTYTFTGPYGTDTCTTNATGTLPRNGCTFDEGGAVGGDVTSATASNRVGPFLVWNTTADRPAGYIGDPNVAHAVTGSPTGFNKVQVRGPGVTGTCVDGATVTQGCQETDQFLVAGQVMDGAQGVATPVSFGPVTQATTKTVTYTNIGNAAAHVVTAAVSGAGFASTADTCTGATVAVGGHCDVDVTFTPTPGQPATGSVTFTDDSAGGTAKAALSGKGAQSKFQAIPGIDFGTVAIGSSASRPITVRNTGDAPLALDTLALQPAASGLAVAGTGTTPCQVNVTTLAPGASCTATVTFTPDAHAARSTQLAVGAVDQVADTLVTVNGVGQDVTAPRVLTRSPAAGATAASRTGNVVVTFTEGVKGVTGTTFRLTNLSTGRAVGAVRTKNATGSRWVLNPNATLAAHTRYRVNLLGGSALVRDLHEVALRSTSWTFRTR
ncbi:MAG: choice-of-anchor D domain-containing protein [Nocardioidaceae bacterium]|nr:choice-of-anchor D domain-containing protein [Nocardioidaceae bacterium]